MDYDGPDGPFRYTLWSGDYTNPQESFANTTSRAVEVIDLLDADEDVRHNAYKGFLGYSEIKTAVVDMTTVRYLSRHLPKPYSGDGFNDASGNPMMWCMAVSNSHPYAAATKAIGTGTDADRFRLALTYSTVPYRIRSDDDPNILPGAGLFTDLPDEGYALSSGWSSSRYVTKKFSPQTRFQTMRPGVLKLRIGAGVAPTDFQPVPEGFPIKVEGGLVEYRWLQVPAAYVPLGPISLCSGRINNNTFDGFPAKTLLMSDGPEITLPYTDCTGQYVVDITYRFAVSFHPARGLNTLFALNQITGWNTLLQFGKDIGIDYFEMSDGVGAGTNKPYKEEDYTALFRPQQP